MSAAQPMTVLSRPALAAAETALLALAVLNGLAVRLVEAWREGSASGLVPGVSPFELIAIAVGLSLLADPGTGARRALGWRELLMAAVLLLPSSAVSWVAAAGYAALLAWDNQGDRRRGALILVALALAALWSSVALRVLAVPLTTFEAALVTNVASLFVDGLVRSGNVIGQAGGHHLVLLSACTSAEALPRAILAVCVVAIFAGARSSERVAVAAAAAALTFVLGNTARLAVMSASHDLYALAHGPIGAGLFDGLQVGLVIAAGYWAARR